MTAESRNNQSGMALIATMMVLMLASALAIGFFATISADQRASGIDRDQTQAYAAAHAGLEKLTTDLATLFEADFSPQMNQINALLVNPPVIPGFTFVAPGNQPGYTITPKKLEAGQPAPLDKVNGTIITSGAYQGLRGLITRYDLTATARSSGAETRLRRALQTVSIPVFQFGVFSDTDLQFYGGDSFDFGGRVHTNGNLFLATAAGQTLSLSDRVTAAQQVVRRQLSNTVSTASGTWSGTVRVIRSPGVYRNLASTEGSVQNGPGSTANEPTWTNLSMGTYNGNIRNGKTGGKRLDLPLVSAGALPIDIIRRPLPGDDPDSSVYKERYYGHQDSSIRILLSDLSTDITNLPTIVAARPPVRLDGDWAAAAPNNGGGAYGPVDAAHPPMPWSPGPSPGAGTNPIGTTYVSTGSSLSSGVATLRVSTTESIPPYYRIPVTLTVQPLVGAAINVTCTGRTATTFTGCTPLPGLTITVAGATVRGNVNSGWAGAFTAQTNLAGSNPTASAWTPGAGNANTITVVSTAAFAPNTMFVDGRVVSCKGYTTVSPPEFRQCYGLTALPANGVTISNGALTPTGTSTIGGFLKVERKNQGNGAWEDVTMEWLNLGIGAPNQLGKACGDPTPTAILRLIRLRDNGLPASESSCGYANSTNPTDWWPQVLYDPREGNLRDQNATTSMTLELGGVMHLAVLDVNNLRLWLAGNIGTTGNQTYSNNGYIVYLSDRRNNRNLASLETGVYGYEDIVNPATSAGTPNNQINQGEDVGGPNGAVPDGTLQLYGSMPNFEGVYNTVRAGSLAPLDINARPPSNLSAGEARVNRAVLFRRALKLVNAGIVGGVNSLPASGLTVATENPVYVQGNYNATDTSVTGSSVPAAIIGDAITILSNAWSDSDSFLAPNNPAGRPAINTGYRFAAVAGKGLSFDWPAWATSSSPFVGSIFGTDGGVGNFLRYVEDWNASGRTILYKGSIVSLYTSRQATGTFKCCTNVYAWGVRNYSFDTNFLTPSLLPPGTPMFRDVNTLTFRQLLRPTE
jgi:hypothetical protein